MFSPISVPPSMLNVREKPVFKLQSSLHRYPGHRVHTSTAVPGESVVLFSLKFASNNHARLSFRILTRLFCGDYSRWSGNSLAIGA